MPLSLEEMVRLLSMVDVFEARRIQIRPSGNAPTSWFLAKGKRAVV
jgi:hypothetical protein